MTTQTSAYFARIVVTDDTGNIVDTIRFRVMSAAVAFDDSQGLSCCKLEMSPEQLTALCRMAEQPS